MSINPQTSHRGQPGAHGYTDGTQLGDEMRDFMLIVLRRLHIVALVAALTVIGVLGYIWTTTPLYSARVEILIDPRQRQTVESEITPTGLGSSAAGADTLLLESQVEVLNSQKVADALIRWENLTEDPEFAGGEAPFFIEMVKTLVKSVIYGPQQSLWKKTSPYDRTLGTLRKRVTVERQRNTYVISVTVRAKKAEKASRIANRIAWIYISEVNSAASSTTREAATILSSKLEELRTAANNSAKAVETYRRENKLIDAKETLLVEQQLSDLNRELSAARTEVQTTLARRNQLRAAIQAEDGSGIRLSEIGESTVMSQLQTRLAGLESQEAALKSVYLQSHPTLKGVRQRKAALRASLRQEYSRILNRLDVAHKTAQEKTSSLRSEVAELEGQVATSNSDTVQLRELEREAATSRTVYENFLRRSKEAWEQVDIPSSTARIISAAFAPSKPSHPRVFMLLAAAIGLGLSLGVLAAFLHNVFKGRREATTAPAAVNTGGATYPHAAAPAAPQPQVFTALGGQTVPAGTHAAAYVSQPPAVPATPAHARH
ncbi:MAG: GumC family protein [Pseudomonadota bacterium]